MHASYVLHKSKKLITNNNMKRFRMRIEVERFPDKRLKMLKIYSKSDNNVRINENEVSICPKIDDLKLEEDVLEAINLWNLIFMSPELKKEIHQILKRHFRKAFIFFK